MITSAPRCRARWKASMPHLSHEMNRLVDSVFGEIVDRTERSHASCPDRGLDPCSWHIGMDPGKAEVKTFAHARCRALGRASPPGAVGRLRCRAADQQRNVELARAAQHLGQIGARHCGGGSHCAAAEIGRPGSTDPCRHRRGAACERAPRQAPLPRCHSRAVRRPKARAVALIRRSCAARQQDVRGQS